MSRQDATSLMMPTAAGGVGSGITTLMHDGSGLNNNGAIRASQPQQQQQANLFGVTASSSASTSIQKQLPTFNN